MKFLITILTFISFLTLEGQSYDTKMIISKADSILKLNVNDSIYQYYKFDSGSYYKYSGFSRNSSFKKDYYGFLNCWGVKCLTENKRTKGHFKNTDVRFRFEYPENKEICGLTFVSFDNHLNLLKPLYLDFIPGFLWNNDSCNFISKQEALEIGIKSFQKSGIEIDEPILEYNESCKCYTYSIMNKLTKTKNQMGKDAGQSEIVRIDAITGELLERFDCPYGVIIR